MEILFIYLFFGLLVSLLIYAVADERPWYLFVGLLVLWLPLIIIGMFLSFFMDLRTVSNKLNMQMCKPTK